MFKKVLIFVLVVLGSLALVFSVNSYSSANVRSSAMLKVTESNNALIAIVDEAKVVKVENNNPSQSNMPSNFSIKVKNNMSNDITIDNVVSKNGNFEIEGVTTTVIASNSEAYINGKITLKDYLQLAEFPYHVDVIIHAKWNGGEARINSCIEVVMKQSSGEDDANQSD